MIPLTGVCWAGPAATTITALYGADKKVNSASEMIQQQGYGGAVVRFAIPSSSHYLGPAARSPQPLASMGGGREMLQWDKLWSQPALRVLSKAGTVF